MNRAAFSRPRVVLLVVLVVLLYAGLLVAYFVDGRSGPTAGPEKPPAGGVLVQVKPISVDPLSGTMTVDISIDLDESLVDEDASVPLSQAPKSDLTVVVNRTLAGAPLRFPAHATIGTTRSQLTTPGFIRDWPFDHYETPLVLSASTGTNAASALPTSLHFEGAVQGWHLWAEPDPDSAGAVDKLAIVTVGFERALGVVLFGGVLVLVLVTLPVIGLSVVLNVARGRREFEPAFLSWIAAMLFATIPIRNFLPGSPPAGSWIDVTIVLWVVVALAVGLVVGVVAWRRQSPLLLTEHADDPEGARDARDAGDAGDARDAGRDV